MIKPPSKIRRLWSRRRWRIAILTILGLAVLGLLTKPSYRLFREWRIERNATGATEALAAGNLPEARRLALAVLRLKAERHDMLVVLQRAMEELDDPNAVGVSRVLMEHAQATEDDRIRGFRATCEGLPLATVTRTWQALGAEKANSPEYLAPYVTRLIDQGLPAEAARLLQFRNDLDLQPILRFQAVRLLFHDPKEEHLDRAQFEISELMENGGTLALPAFRLLSGVPLQQFRSAYFPELESWIAAWDGATTDDRLLALVQRLQRYPDQKPEIIQNAIQQYAKGDPAAVARWLLPLGQAELALGLLPEDESAADNKRFQARTAALLALQRWEESRLWLASPPDSFPLIEVDALRTVVKESAENSAHHGCAWSFALSGSASKSAAMDLIDLQQRLHEAGFEEPARKTMVEALRGGRGRLPYWAQVRDLLPWLHTRQQGQEMFEICSVMASLEPTNTEVVLEALDLACVFGKIQPSMSVERVGKLKSLNPEITAASRFREVLATALLADGKAAEAITSLEPDSTTDPQIASTRAIAVRALAHAMLGDEAASTQLLARVDWKQMLREEREFFTRLLAKLSAPGTTEPIGTRFDPKILPPSDAPVEDPPEVKELPPLTDDFGKKADPKELPSIPEAIDAEFKPKLLPPVEDTRE